MKPTPHQIPSLLADFGEIREGFGHLGDRGYSRDLR
jgi:hypothetical protein